MADTQNATISHLLTSNNMSIPPLTEEERSNQEAYARVTFIFYGVAIPFIVLMCALAAMLNLLIFSSRCYVRKKAASLELTYSLALSDTWTSAVIALSLFWNSYKPVMLGSKNDSVCFPMMLEAFRTGGMLTGTFHFAALAFAHYLQIVRPFDHAKILSLRTCYVMIVLMWLVPPIGFLLYASMEEGQGLRSERCMNIDFYIRLPFRLNLSVLIVVLMLVTVAVYARLLIVLNRVRGKALGPSANSAVLLRQETLQCKSADMQQSSAARKNRRTVVTAAIMFGTFIVGWTPASVVFFLTAKGMPMYKSHAQQPPIWLSFLSFFVLIMIMIKSLTNPIIYAIRIPEVRVFVQNRLLFKLLRKPFKELEETISSRRKSDYTQIRVDRLQVNASDMQKCSTVTVAIPDLEKSTVNI